VNGPLRDAVISTLPELFNSNVYDIMLVRELVINLAKLCSTWVRGMHAEEKCRKKCKRDISWHK
jgi:hypothetical protein